MENSKHCELCNKNITKQKFSRHLQSASHKNKDSQIVTRQPKSGIKTFNIYYKRKSFREFLNILRRINLKKKVKKLQKKRKRKNERLNKILLSEINDIRPDEGESNAPKHKSLKVLPQQYENFNLIEGKSKFNKKFNVWEIDYKIEMNELEVGNLNNAFEEIMTKIRERTLLRNGDKLELIIGNPNLNTNYVSTGLLTVNEGLDPVYELGQNMINVMTSDETITLEDSEFHVRVLSMPQGRGSKGNKIVNLAEDKQLKRSIIQVKNMDNLCLPRSVVVALSALENWTDKRKEIFLNLGLKNEELIESKMRYIKDSRKPLQRTLALNLLRICGIDSITVKETGCTLEHIKQIEEILGIQINVVCAENFNSIIHSGPIKEIMIYLYKDKNHFDVIKNMTGFLGCVYYCHTHKKHYNNKDSCSECKKDEQYIKRLKSICQACSGPKHSEESYHDANGKIAWVECSHCFRFFLNIECFQNHLKTDLKGQSACTTIWKCRKCKKNIKLKERNPQNHVCGESQCLNCKQYVILNEHECYMQKKPAKGGYCTKSDVFSCKLFEPKKNWCFSCHTYTERYLFFDFECQQHTGTHEVNFCCVQDFDGNERTFHNIDDFCKWLISKEHRGYTAIAHNAKGYDSQFILKYCVENTLKPYTIYSGSKLMLLEIPHLKLKIIDSINFIQSSLSAFPKTFGLKELKKGYFPHYFNKPCNQNYVGPLPSKKHYGYNQMKTEERQKFLDWYNKKISENYIFDFKKELEEYCRSDVDILRRGCLSFREIFLEVANIDPLQYLTIAGACMAIYRALDLPENTIAVVQKEYKEDIYSKESICWLDYRSQIDKCTIQHALNGGEKTIIIDGKILKVDGYCKATNTVYQFHGCFWHGCPKCYKPDVINNKNQTSMKDLYKRTERISDLIKKKYNLIEIWECEFKEKKEVKAFMKTWKRKVITPLNPRDSFYGGRTNATKLLYNCRKSHKLRYIDVCSLYPTVQFYDYYPIKHPNKIINPDYFDKTWFGFIKCKVLPPKGLYHPVLPTRINTGKAEKLLFPLCYTCAVNKIQKCTHSDEERAIIGTWCSNELLKAIDKGYHVEKIYEVWHFDEKSNDLFKSYVKRFMKIKLEASGVPKGMTIDEYINESKEKLDITLDKVKIEVNPGKRSVAKMCLNSLWGKFGQRQNMGSTEYVTDVKRFYDIVLDDKLDNINFNILTDGMIEVSYKYKDQFVENDFNTNTYIAAFTTANARLRLYDMLDYLGENVCYFDTDCSVYIDDGTKQVKTGSLLGEWENELGNSYGVRWVSTGPKSYSLEQSNSEFKCRVKGFTLNYENSQFINHKTMVQMVNSEIKGKTIVEENKITRDPKTKSIINKYQEKFFKFDYDKRVINKINDDQIDTLPYGY
jgi:hypothetical protein